jgi:hypothetical protein
MEHRHITSLYKYRAFNEYSLSNLKNDTIWLAKPGSFNDPFDCALEVDKTFSAKRYRSWSKELGKMIGMSKAKIKNKLNIDFSSKKVLTRQARNHINTMYAELIALFENLGVYCMTEVPDNILMWSHYADSHRGFCLEHDRSEDNPLGSSSLDMTEWGTEVEREMQWTKKVSYASAYPTICILDLLTATNWRALHLFLLTKSVDWAYEEEWRLTGYPGGRNVPNPGRIKSVIFGMRMVPEHREQLIRELEDRPGIVFREARKMNGAFSVRIHDL